MLPIVNKAKSSLQNTLITLVKFRPCLGGNVGYRVKGLVSIMKTLILFTYSLSYAQLLPPLFFSLKHIACHAFTDKISGIINKYMLHEVFPVCPN